MNPSKTLRQRCHGNRMGFVARIELFQAGDAGQINAVVAQQLQQTFAAACAFGHDEHAVFGRSQVVLQFFEWLGCTPIHAQVGQGLCPVRGLLGYRNSTA